MGWDESERGKRGNAAEEEQGGKIARERGSLFSHSAGERQQLGPLCVWRLSWRQRGFRVFWKVGSSPVEHPTLVSSSLNTHSFTNTHTQPVLMLRRAVAVLTLQVEQPAATVLSGTQHVKTHTRRSYLLLYCGSLVTTGWRQSDRQRVSPWSRGCADPSWILQQMKHVKAGSARERYCRRFFFFLSFGLFPVALW